MNLLENASLKSLNTFGMDVRAKILAQLDSEIELQEILALRDKQNIPLFILGGGSNILFSKDIDALVLLNRLRGIERVEENDDTTWLKVAAGENWHSFVQHCIGADLGGIENLSLIPGNVGASPMQNIGAYGVEIKDIFHSLDAINLSTGLKRTFSKEECQFGYRESVFKQEEKNKWLISSVTYRLSRKNHVLHTGYGAISDELKTMGVEQPDIRTISEAVIRIRRSKLPDPAEIGNAGSFFKNPVVENSLAEQLKKSHPSLVSYPAGVEHSKLAAGWLIEQAGWKGFRKGDAGVHARQALVLVNYGNASGQEVLDLANTIIADVRQKFGVDLEKEVNQY